MIDPLGEAFDRRGFCVLPSVVDPATVDALRQAISAFERELEPTPQVLYTHAAPPPDLPSLTSLLTQWRNAWRRLDPALGRRLVDQVAAGAARVAGFAPVPFQDVVTCRDGEQREFPWHQDVAYWPVDREDGVVAWLALDDVDESNGGVELAPGSHRAPVGPSIDLHSGLPQPGAPGAFEAPERGVVPSLAAGDALYFHARCWHRSGVNRSGAPRRAWAASFLHPETRWRFSRAPRHHFTTSVIDGEEVAAWANQRYRHARA